MKTELSNKELVKAGHQFAKAIGMDTPLIEIAKMIAELASRLDCAIVRGDMLQAERDALAEKVQKLEWDSVFIPNNLDQALTVMGVSLPESKEEFNLPVERWIQRLVDRVIRVGSELDVTRNSLRAEGVEMLADAIGSPYVDSDQVDYNAGFNRAIEVVKTRTAPKLANQLRAQASKDGE